MLCTMDGFREFLETSTIHGLSHISTSKGFARFFWVLIVITGFTIACVLINQSFEDWAASPIKTTIETKPIAEIDFPKVTVCPPKGSFTNLNFDLMNLRNVTLSNETREELAHFAFDLIHESAYNEAMANLSKFEEQNRAYNWYHGFTEISFPQLKYYYYEYYIQTSAVKGFVQTQFFGDAFDAEKVDPSIEYMVEINPPTYLLNSDDNITLTVSIRNVSMFVPSKYGKNNYFDRVTTTESQESIVYDPDKSLMVLTIKPSKSTTLVKLKRYVSKEIIEDNTGLKLMPGIQVKWSYDQDVTPEKLYDPTYQLTFVKLFRRYFIKGYDY